MPGTRSSGRLRNASSNSGGGNGVQIFVVDRGGGGEFGFSAYSTLDKAENFMHLNPGATLVPNCSKDAYRKQFFLEGVEVGDKIYLQKYFSDLSGRTFVGNASKNESTSVEDISDWKVITRSEKEGSAEISVLYLTLQ
jgi:hypothetical protein